MSDFWSKKKILITGGAGFIGRFLVERLLESKAEISIVELPNRLPWLNDLRGRIKIFAGDLMNDDFCNKVFKDIDYCFHLAAFKKNFGYHLENPFEVLSKNQKINANVMNGAKSNQIKGMLLISSTTVFRSSLDYLTEDSPLNSDFCNDDGYSWSKIILEQQAKFLNKESGIKIKIARCDNVYGPKDNFSQENSQVIPSLISKAFNDSIVEVWGSGEQKRTFLYVEDCANALMSMMENSDKFLLLNLSGSEIITLKELIDKIIGLSGLKRKVFFNTTKPEGCRVRICGNQKALETLGWKPLYDLDRGLKMTIDFYVEQIGRGNNYISENDENENSRFN